MKRTLTGPYTCHLTYSLFLQSVEPIWSKHLKVLKKSSRKSSCFLGAVWTFSGQKSRDVVLSLHLWGGSLWIMTLVSIFLFTATSFFFFIYFPSCSGLITIYFLTQISLQLFQCWFNSTRKFVPVLIWFKTNWFQLNHWSLIPLWTCTLTEFSCDSCAKRP